MDLGTILSQSCLHPSVLNEITVEMFFEHDTPSSRVSQGSLVVERETHKPLVVRSPYPPGTHQGCAVGAT